MRTYLWVIFLIFGMMGTYIALLPLTAWSEVKAGVPGAGPF